MRSLSRPVYVTKAEPPPECPLAYGEWLDRAPGHDEDFLPELPDYQPELPGRAWWAEELELLESQRPACAALPETLAYLDEQIGHTRRGLVLATVADWLARTREGHEG